MFGVKVHNRQAAPLNRRSAVLKIDDSLMARIAGALIDLLRPAILLPLAGVAAIVAYGLYLGHL